MRRRTLLAAGLATGGLALTSGLPALAQTKPGRWQRLESANFIVFSSLPEIRSREELIALESFRGLLAKLMPRNRAEPKLRVHMAGSTRDFEMLAPWAEKEIFGYYSPGVEDVHAGSKAIYLPDKYSRSDRFRTMDARVVLLHEYAHHYIMANTRLSYPAWYNEGVAEFLSTVEITDKGATLGKFTDVRAMWLTSGDWLDIKTFLGDGKKKLSRDDTARFYAQAWLATHYFFTNGERSEGLDRYIKALHDGGDAIGSFEPSFGITLEAFDAELREYKRKPMRYLNLTEIRPDPNLPIKVGRLSAAADDLLMPMTYLATVPGPKRAAKSLALIRERAPKFKDDPLALRARAVGEVWYGDPTEARKLVDTLLPTHAEDADIQHLSGLCDLRAAYRANDPAMFKRARAGFAAAHRIDNSRAGSLYRYVECWLGETGKVDEHVLDVMITLYNLSPQVGPFAIAAAQGLMQHNRMEEAADVLRPLGFRPHGGNNEAVEEVMAAFKAGTPPPFKFPNPASIVEDEEA